VDLVDRLFHQTERLLLHRVLLCHDFAPVVSPFMAAFGIRDYLLRLPEAARSYTNTSVELRKNAAKLINYLAPA
jgi:hypothetical protein